MSIENHVMKELKVVSNGNQRFQMRFLMASYIADISEAENLLAVKREKKLSSPDKSVTFDGNSFLEISSPPSVVSLLQCSSLKVFNAMIKDLK